MFAGRVLGRVRNWLKIVFGITRIGVPESSMRVMGYQCG